MFIAMFDEYDEGTAIAKAAPTKMQIPVAQNFVTLDVDGYNLQSDHYLVVAANITRDYHDWKPEPVNDKSAMIIALVISGIGLLLIIFSVVMICIN